MRIALVSRELYPFGGGGIGQFANAAATLLSESAEVMLLTSSTHRDAYLRALSVGDPRLTPPSVRVEFVPEPTLDEAGPWSTFAHLYSARVYERLRQLYPDGGPDVLEFGDYAAEAFVTLQAAQAFDRFLTRTCVCVRVHTSSEICAVLNGHSSRRSSPTTAPPVLSPRRSTRCWPRPTRGSRSCSSTTGPLRRRTGSWPSSARAGRSSSSRR